MSWVIPVFHFSDGFLPFLRSMSLEYYSTYMKPHSGQWVLIFIFRSKINTRFVSYVYDPVQEEVLAPTTLSDGAIRRYITLHAFAVQPTNVSPGRRKRSLHKSTSAPG